MEFYFPIFERTLEEYRNSLSQIHSPVRTGSEPKPNSEDFRQSLQYFASYMIQLVLEVNYEVKVSEDEKTRMVNFLRRAHGNLQCFLGDIFERLARVAKSPWGNPTLLKIMKNMAVTPDDVDECLQNEGHMLIQHRLQTLYHNECYMEAINLSLCCSSHPEFGKQKCYLEMALWCMCKQNYWYLVKDQLKQMSCCDVVNMIRAFEREDQTCALNMARQGLIIYWSRKQPCRCGQDIAILWVEMEMKCCNSDQEMVLKILTLQDICAASFKNQTYICDFVKAVGSKVSNEVIKEVLQPLSVLCLQGMKNIVTRDNAEVKANKRRENSKLVCALIVLFKRADFLLFKDSVLTYFTIKTNIGTYNWMSNIFNSKPEDHGLVEELVMWPIMEDAHRANIVHCLKTQRPIPINPYRKGKDVIKDCKKLIYQCRKPYKGRTGCGHVKRESNKITCTGIVFNQTNAQEMLVTENGKTSIDKAVKRKVKPVLSEEQKCSHQIQLSGESCTTQPLALNIGGTRKSRTDEKLADGSNLPEFKHVEPKRKISTCFINNNTSKSSGDDKVAVTSNVPMLKHGELKRKIQTCFIDTTSQSSTGEKVAGASNLQVLKHSEPKRKMKSSFIGSSSESNNGEKVVCASNVPVLKRGDPKRKVQICVIRSTSESNTGEKVAGASNLQVLKHSEPKRKMKSFIGSSSESNNGEKVVCASNVRVLKHSEPKSKIETCLIDSKSNGEKLPHARNVSALKCNVKIAANPETKVLLTVLETDNIPKKQEVWQKKLQSTDLYVPFSMLRFSSSSCQQNPDTIRSSNQANALDCSVFPKKKTGGNSCGIRKSNDSSCMDISQGIHSKDTQKCLFTKGNTTAIKRRSSIHSRDSSQCYVNETKCGESTCINVEQSHVLTDNLVQDKPCLTKDVSDTKVAHSIYMSTHGNEPVGQDIPEEKGIPNSAEWNTEQNEHLAMPDSAAGRKRTLPPEQVQQKSGSRQELIQQSNQVEIAQEKISGNINAELYLKSNGDHHDTTGSGSFMLDKPRFLPHMNASTIEIPSESDLVIKVENIPVGPKDSVKATGTKDSVRKKPVSTDELERAKCEPRSVRRIRQRSSHQNMALSRKSDGDIASTYFYEPNYIQEMSSTRGVDMSCTSLEEREHLKTSSTGNSTTFNSDTLTYIVKGRENEENSDKAKTGAPLSSQVKNTPESRHTDAADSSVLSPETVERSVCVPKSGASKVLERRTSEKQGVGTDHEDFSGGYSCVLEDEEQRDCNSDSCVWHSCYCMLVDDEQLPYEAKEDDKCHSSNMSQEQLVTDVLSSPVEQVQDSSSRNPQQFAHSGRLKGSAEDLTVDSRSTEQQQCTQKGSNNGSAVEFMRNDLPGRQIEIPLTKRTGSSSIEVVFSNLSAKPLPFTRDERITDSGEVHTHHSLLAKPSLLVGDQRESDSEVKHLPPVVEYKLNNLSAKPKDERNSNSAEVQPMESWPLASNPVPRFKNESKNYSAHDHTDNASETLPLTMDESGDFESDHILNSVANKTSLFTRAQRRNDSEMECTVDNIPTIGKSPSTTNDHGDSNFAFESTMDVQEYGRDIGFDKQNKVENITHQPQSHKQDEVKHSFVCVALKQQQSKKHARPEPKRDSGHEKDHKIYNLSSKPSPFAEQKRGDGSEVENTLSKLPAVCKLLSLVKDQRECSLELKTTSDDFPTKEQYKRDIKYKVRSIPGSYSQEKSGCDFEVERSQSDLSTKPLLPKGRGCTGNNVEDILARLSTEPRSAAQGGRTCSSEVQSSQRDQLRRENECCKGMNSVIENDSPACSKAVKKRSPGSIEYTGKEVIPESPSAPVSEVVGGKKVTAVVDDNMNLENSCGELPVPQNVMVNSDIKVIESKNGNSDIPKTKRRTQRRYSSKCKLNKRKFQRRNELEGHVPNPKKSTFCDRDADLLLEGQKEEKSSGELPRGHSENFERESQDGNGNQHPKLLIIGKEKRKCIDGAALQIDCSEQRKCQHAGGKSLNEGLKVKKEENPTNPVTEMGHVANRKRRSQRLIGSPLSKIGFFGQTANPTLTFADKSTRKSRHFDHSSSVKVITSKSETSPAIAYDEKSRESAAVPSDDSFVTGTAGGCATKMEVSVDETDMLNPTTEVFVDSANTQPKTLMTQPDTQIVEVQVQSASTQHATEMSQPDTKVVVSISEGVKLYRSRKCTDDTGKYSDM